MKMIVAGQMRNVIEIQKVKGNATALADGRIDHSTESNWTTVARKRAAIFARGSREFWRNDQLQADVTHRVVLWQDSDTDKIRPMDRLLWNASKLNILGMPQRVDEKGRQVVIECVEVDE